MYETAFQALAMVHNIPAPISPPLKKILGAVIDVGRVNAFSHTKSANKITNNTKIPLK